MTRDPVRWLESSESPELVTLMRVGADELAPPEALARVGERLAAGALVSSTSSLPRRVPQASSAVSSASGLKVLGLALLLGAAGLGLYQLVRPPAPASAPALVAPRAQAPALPDLQRSSHAEPAADTTEAPATSLDQVEPERAQPAQVQPRAMPRRARARTLAQPSKSSAQPVDARLEQARLLEQARRALSAQPEQALALLREHAVQFPQSWLEEEREAMMVRALAQSGQSAAARTQLAHFNARFPHSVHAERLERALIPP